MTFEASHTDVEARFLANALRPGARALDAGCGRTTRLAGHRDRIAELVGVDVDAAPAQDFNQEMRNRSVSARPPSPQPLPA